MKLSFNVSQIRTSAHKCVRGFRSSVDAPNPNLFFTELFIATYPIFHRSGATCRRFEDVLIYQYFD